MRPRFYTLRFSFVFSFLAGFSLAGSVPARAAVSDGPYKELPVVLKGGQLPAFTGISEGDLAAFRYLSGNWFRLPLQVDGVYDADTCAEVGLAPVPAGADPKVSCLEKRIDFSGGLDIAGLDADDELVFLPKEAGAQAPTNSHPAGVFTTPRYEVQLLDMRGGGYAYVYIYRQESAAPVIPYNISYTTANGRLAPDDLPGDLGCPADQNQYTDIVTDYYCAHWATRWSLDDLVLKPTAAYSCSKLGRPGAADGTAPDEDTYDLLDRWKGHEQNVGNAVDDAYWGCRSRLLGEKKGAVRYIRGVLGAKSGLNTTFYGYYYPRYIRSESRLRVHTMPGIARVFDWNDQARGAAIYHGDNMGLGNGGSGIIDGDAANDSQQSHSLRQNQIYQWDLLSAGSGRIFIFSRPDPALNVVDFTLDPALGGKGFQYFYADQEAPLNDPANREETKSSLGNFGNLFDLRTPKESCLAFCSGASLQQCQSGTAPNCTTGTYYQPLIVQHGLQLLPAASGNDGANLAYVENYPLTVNLVQQGSEACNDGDTRSCPLTRGVCAGKLQSCSGGVWQPCNYGPDFQQGREARCDGLDNDCDGDIDQEFLVGRACSAGIGECRASGTYLCTDDHMSSYCSATPRPAPEPGRELSCADNKDNDCDGSIDGADPDCVSGCLDNDGDGYKVGIDCPLGTPVDCHDANPAIHPGAAERCDSIDNNCSGQVDEGFNAGQPCSAGVGACQRAGIFRCSADGLGTICDARPEAPQTEICGNGIDEDCDGADLSCPPDNPNVTQQNLTGDPRHPTVDSGCQVSGGAALALILAGWPWLRRRFRGRSGN